MYNIREWELSSTLTLYIPSKLLKLRYMLNTHTWNEQVYLKNKKTRGCFYNWWLGLASTNSMDCYVWFLSCWSGWKAMFFKSMLDATESTGHSTNLQGEEKNCSSNAIYNLWWRGTMHDSLDNHAIWKKKIEASI